MNKIYFDHAATTPVDPQVLEAILPYFSEKYGNASSMHAAGKEAVVAVDQARETIAKFFNCSPQEIIFTSGATESNNLIIKGSLKSAQSLSCFKEKKPHIITSNIEHPAILETCKLLEKDGVIDLTLVPVDKEGIINPADIEKAITDSTILVTIMYVNNEIGTIQPIKEIGRLLKKVNKTREEKQIPRITFHTDAVQAINYLECDVDSLMLDSFSMSGHKIYGPKGIGLLYLRKGTSLKRIQDGGSQEYRLRAGTTNVPGVIGIGKAIELVNPTEDNKKLKELQEYFLDKINKEIPDAQLNGNLEKRIPSNINLSFKGVEGESILLSLDMEGIAVSTGSACASGSLEPSHVISAIGRQGFDAHSSIRFALGKNNTKEEIDQVVSSLKSNIAKLVKVSGSLGKKY